MIGVYRLLLGIVFMVTATSPCGAVTWATEWTQILNNIQLLEQTKHQIDGLYNDAVMIRNQVEALKSIASYKGSWGDVDQILVQIEAVRQRNTSVWNNVQSAYNQVRELYPDIAAKEDYGLAVKTLNNPVLAAADGGFQVTVDQGPRMAVEDQVVRNLLEKSDNAVGQTQALQTMNQLMGQLINQMQELRALNEWQLAQKSAEARKQAELENKEQKDMEAVFHVYAGSSSTTVLNAGF